MKKDKQAQVLASMLGKCWHEWEEIDKEAPFKIYICSSCKQRSSIPDIWEHNPFSGSRLNYETIDLLAEKWPVLWEEYLKFSIRNKEYTPTEYTDGFNKCFSIDNFFYWLEKEENEVWLKNLV